MSCRINCARSALEHKEVIENLLEGCHKASKGLIRVIVDVKDDAIKGVMIAGDFLCIQKTNSGILREVWSG